MGCQYKIVCTRDRWGVGLWREHVCLIVCVTVCVYMGRCIDTPYAALGVSIHLILGWVYRYALCVDNT